MYRLSRFFVSDVIAGQNIIKNGYFPICKEGERADHGVLFATNGSCKTTLLSFLLSVFNPEKNRFVQHLQSGGDKTLEQYLIAGRPAVVLIELVATLEATLFEAEPVERVLVGQLLVRDTHDPGKVERLFFKADDPQFFDTLRGAWEGLVDGSEPRKAVRDFIAPHVDSTHLQNEWRETLTSMGLDPWLMDRQVDFARTEGGIKDAFKFKTEDEFMSFFLGCVTDIDEASALRGTVQQNMAKMASRPEKKAQLKTIWSLKERISNFDALGGKWRSARDQVNTHHRQLGEAHHLLLLSAKANGRKMAEVKAAKAATLDEKSKVIRNQEQIKANTLQVQAKVLEGEVTGLRVCIEENTALLERGKAEQAAIKAAGFMAVKRKTEAEIKDGEEVLSSKGAELVPIQEQIELRARQYHARLVEERTACKSRLVMREEEKQALTEAQLRNKEAVVALREQTQGVQQEMTHHKAMISAGEGALVSLGLEGEENPRGALARLQGSLEQMAARKGELEGEIHTLKQSLAACDERFEAQQRLVIEGEMACVQAKKQVAAEASARQALQSDGTLAMLAGARDFDPTRSALSTKLQEAVSRQQEKAHAATMTLMGLEAERDRLESMGTMAVDEETRKLLNHYLGVGLTRAELKLFPEYLSSRYEDPAIIAAFLTRDPGRFSGMMAASDQVVEKVRALDVPSWLCRPVVISTPCELADVREISPHVISPTDPSVYSPEYLAKRLEGVKEEVQHLVVAGDAVNNRLRELQRSERALSDYRRLYPDSSAVEALSHGVKACGDQLDRFKADVAEQKSHRAEILGRLVTTEEALANAVGVMGCMSQQLAHVSAWVGQYGAMDSWRGVLNEKERQLQTMNRELGALEEVLQGLDQKAQSILETLAETRSELKALDEKGVHIPLKGDGALLDEQLEEALSYDLESLETLYRDARNRENEMAGKLGIATLTETLQRLHNTLQKVTHDLGRCKRESPFDVVEAHKWASKGIPERDARTAELLASIEDAMENKGRLSTELGAGREKLETHLEKLTRLINRGITPTLTDDDVAGRESEDLLNELSIEAGQLQETLNRLESKLPELDALEKSFDGWARDLAVGTAQVKPYPFLWDEISPRLGWPEIAITQGESVPTTAFLSMVDECLSAVAAADKEVSQHRQRMGSAFDRLQTELRDDVLQRRLPTIVDELRRHDADTLGHQSADFIEKCNYLAQNIEGDLARSEKFVKSLIDMLLQHAKECHGKLQEATNKKVTDDVYIYGGQPIIKCGTRLEFTRHEEIFRSTLDHWLHELIEQGRMPEVNPKAGNVLGSELLYRLLRAASGKVTFGVRLLKCDDSGRHYEQVGKDLGSGGEALTTAVLLYTLLTFMRQKRKTKNGRIPAFLIADNPLGVCNRSDFLDAQLKVARAMGIQCVYFTGINDRESLGLFEHRVAIRKSEKRLRIEQVDYTCLEVVEQHVETKDQYHGEHTAQ